MPEAEFAEFLQEKGYVTISRWLLEKHQALDISPQELGYLLLAIYHHQKITSKDDFKADLKSGFKTGSKSDSKSNSNSDFDADSNADSKAGYADYAETGASGGQPRESKNPWIGWALENGWAVWSGEGEERQISFEPIWRKLYDLWSRERDIRISAKKAANAGVNSDEKDFNYSKIVKELDRLRGGPSVTIRETQLIQELNLKYGWSSEFILSFFNLCAQRDLLRISSYSPLAARIHRAGIYTLEGLADFMSDVDWMGKKAAEIKKDYLGKYGMVTVIERDYYVKWNVTWGFSHGVIARAAEETVGAANASFRYVDIVLTRWRELGVKTLEDCEEAIKAWNERKSARNAPSQARAPVRSERAKRGGAREDSPWREHFSESSNESSTEAK